MLESQTDTRTTLTVSFQDDILVDKESVSHFHDSYELAFFLHADCQMFVKDRSYHLQDGDMLLMDEYELHNVFYQRNTRHCRYVVNFDRACIEACLNALGIGGMLHQLAQRSNRKARLDVKNRMDVEQLLSRTHALNNHRNRQADAYRLASIKTLLVQVLLIYRDVTAEGSTQGIASASSDQAQAIIGYLDRNYASEITLDGLESRFHTSKYHLCRTFKQTTGFSIVGYIQFRRVLEAQRLLLSTSKMITEIGSACGFASSQDFCRVFKNITGTTARKFRANQ